jgi:hypothetical protein
MYFLLKDFFFFYEMLRALKGLSHEMDLALMTCMVRSRPKQGPGQFLLFLGAPMILNCKKCISRG